MIESLCKVPVMNIYKSCESDIFKEYTVNERVALLKVITEGRLVPSYFVAVYSIVPQFPTDSLQLLITVPYQSSPIL